MATDNLADLAWLARDEAAAWLSRLAAVERVDAALVVRLRRELSSQRARLLLEQVELRRRARLKFADANQLFFTRVGLEQASSDALARHKAARFPFGAPTLDLCCGVGGDLLALAARGPALGVDRDPVAALLAEANLRRRGLAGGVVIADVRALVAGERAAGEFAAWHADPDRRAGGKRTSQAAFHDPPLEVFDALRRAVPTGAVKLAPAADLPADWQAEAELEWLGERDECKQLVAWLGGLARAPGRRGAAVVSGERVHAFSASPVDAAIVAEVGEHLFEPHAAVYAARLQGAVAESLGLNSLGAGAGYLTGDAAAPPRGLGPLLRAFRVREVLPWDEKRVRAALRARGWGRLEIKQRGVRHDLAALARRLAGPGDERGVLLLTRGPRRQLAILAQRHDTDGDPIDDTEGDDAANRK